MKLFSGWVLSAGLVFTAAAANAQVLVPHGAVRSYMAVSDFDGPYAAVPEEGPVVRYGPPLLPPPEVYAILRDNGFAPLGALRQRGFVYTIAAIDPDGQDGRLVIDGRNGRILRFMPAYRMGEGRYEDMTVTYGPAGAPLPASPIRYPRPPAPIPHVGNPHVASRMPAGVPVPREAPPRPAGEAPHTVGEARPSAAGPAPAPAQQSAAVDTRPAVPQILPTQEMPKVQGLD